MSCFYINTKKKRTFRRVRFFLFEGERLFLFRLGKKCRFIRQKWFFWRGENAVLFPYQLNEVIKIAGIKKTSTFTKDTEKTNDRKKTVFMKSLLEFWTDMFKWQYTASRKQYWLPTIVYSVLFDSLFYRTGIALTGFSYLTLENANMFVLSLGVVLFIAQLSLTIRRLHDTNHSGAWLLMGLIPIVGWLLLIYMLCQPTNEAAGANYSTYLNQSTR